LTLGLGEGPGCETVALRSLAGSHEATDVPLIAGAVVGKREEGRGGGGGEGKGYSELWYLTAAGSPGSWVLQVAADSSFKTKHFQSASQEAMAPDCGGSRVSTSEASDDICVMVQGLKIFPLDWPQFEKSHTFLVFGCKPPKSWVCFYAVVKSHKRVYLSL